MTKKNEWRFGGELVSFKNQNGEFAATIKVRGSSQRNEFSSSQICEITGLVPHDVFTDFERRGVEVYDKVVVSGHIETWRREYDDKVKVRQMLIVESLLEVTKNNKMERNRF